MHEQKDEGAKIKESYIRIRLTKRYRIFCSSNNRDHKICKYVMKRLLVVVIRKIRNMSQIVSSHSFHVRR